jgi:UDP-3-O-[3-hydroxymyristoyl] glucosamine N-acyltransferase
VKTNPLTAQAVADIVGGRLSGPGDGVLRRVRSLEQAEPDALAMCASRKYATAMATTRAGAVLVVDALAGDPGPATRIVVADPVRAMYLATRSLHPDDTGAPGVAPTAQIGRGSQLGEGANVGPYAVIGAGVRLGARSRIGPHVVIEDGVIVGDDVRLDAHVVVYAGAVLGDRVWCKASAVIGGQGFGFASDASGHARIPHVGGCIIEDDVEIGSNSCVDRGSLDDTRIGRGTKLDNIVHVGHNVHIGTHCLLMAGAGVGGSTVIGDRVILAGHAGVIDHVNIGDNAKVGAKSLVIADIPPGTSVSGNPARPHREFLRSVATMYRLGPYAETLESLAKEREDA